MSSTSISNLPVEMLGRILRMLPPKSLKTVMLVCKLWKGMVDDPRLWTWAVVPVYSRLDLHRLQINRLQLIDKIRLSRPGSRNRIQPEDLSTVLKVIVDIPSITMFYGIESYNLGSVEPSLLARALAKLDVLRPLHLSNISTAQYEHIFTAIAHRETPMNELTVVGFELTELSPTLFASAASSVKELRLFHCSGDKMLALLQEIAETERPLVKLEIDSCRIKNIDPNLVGKALNKLEEVNIEGCKHGWVSHELLTATLRGVLENQSKLKKFMLNDVYSSFPTELDEELLRQAAKKISWKLVVKDYRSS